MVTMSEVQKYDQQNVLDYSLNLANDYLKSVDYQKRKKIGQFFTPKKNAEFMANCINLDAKQKSVLDPGAGTGILSAAVSERIFNDCSDPISLSIVAYENDKKIIPVLKSTLKACEQRLSQKGHKLTYRIEQDDFITANSHYFQIDENSPTGKRKSFFDAVIANPPYFKIPQQSLQSIASRDYVFGQPNIYSLFMIMSAIMIKPHGDIVFITPRSFCSGFYYRKIREWFINNTSFRKVHIFESRKKVFCEEKILQETIIFHTIKDIPTDANRINISISFDRKFELKETFPVKKSEFIINRKHESFIRLPSSSLELKIIDTVDSWSKTLQDLGFNISTGPVVEHRNRESIKDNVTNKNDVPLFLMQNMIDDKIVWPYTDSVEKQGIQINEKTMKYLLPIENYVLLRRVTSKEQKKRVCAAPFYGDHYGQFKLIGFENHLNYIYKTKGSLSESEMIGLVALLNSKITDIYFRILNGNNQVNATEMRTFPLPELEKIRLLGKEFLKQKNITEYDADCKIADFLNIERTLIDKIYNKKCFFTS
jgi:adenine-specific DNA-methyltransferase